MHKEVIIKADRYWHSGASLRAFVSYLKTRSDYSSSLLTDVIAYWRELYRSKGLTPTEIARQVDERRWKARSRAQFQEKLDAGDPGALRYATWRGDIGPGAALRSIAKEVRKRP